MKKTAGDILVFGEVLFDCFSTGEEVLGGAPFNVAWHLQAFGDRPRFLSRVGDDELGHKILSTMQSWTMDRTGVQIDSTHPTGRVDVAIIDEEPHYTIMSERAYDYITAMPLEKSSSDTILYHGTLGIRAEVSRRSLEMLSKRPGLSIFLDVNLRAPWWKLEEVTEWLKRARWVKLNQDELKALGYDATDITVAMAELQKRYDIEQLILTRGAKGAIVRSKTGHIDEIVPDDVGKITDTVGAGDAFTAMYVHGVMQGWSIPKTLSRAQRFAGKVIGLRGATTTDKAFYQGVTD